MTDAFISHGSKISISMSVFLSSGVLWIIVGSCEGDILLLHIFDQS